MPDASMPFSTNLSSEKRSGYEFLSKELLASGEGPWRIYGTPSNANIYLPGIMVSHGRLDSDTQSDDTGIPLAKQSVTEFVALKKQINALMEHLRERKRELEETFWSEEPSSDEDQSDEELANPAMDDLTQCPPSDLIAEILNPSAAKDVSRLRELILIAEDTDFSPQESALLAPWLLNFALQQRDSNDPEDTPVVWSAIRTGASMLKPEAADQLRPLLEPGHPIETSLVALKMLGRIFEAQPPTDVDQHLTLAADVRGIATLLLNRYAITISQSATMAQLAIHALAATASSEAIPVAETTRELKVAWFTQGTTRELRDLREAWQSRSTPVADGPRELLDAVMRTLTEN